MGEGFSPNIIQPGAETPGPEQNPESLESALSPEAVEAIMVKVKDINEKGVAYTHVADFGTEDDGNTTFVNAVKEAGGSGDVIEKMDEIKKEAIGAQKSIGIKRLIDVLKLGVQGGVNMENERKEYGVQEWKESLKSTKKNLVHFNIVGRSFDAWGRRKISPTEIGNSRYMRRQGSVGIIFDISRMRELPPQHRNIGTWCRGRRKRDTFRTNSPELHSVWEKLKQKYPDLELGDERIKNYNDIFDGKFDEEGYPLPDTEYGFVLSPRIQPRSFQGIVITKELQKSSSYRIATPEEYLSEWQKNAVESVVAAYGEDFDRYLPVYDTDGNLLWPKQMSYEEVKKFVAERNAGKRGIEDRRRDSLPFPREG